MNSVKEEWRKIANLNGYSVSNLGKVRNDKTGRILKTYDNGRGYQKVEIKNKKWYIHRLVAQAFIPNPNNYPQVNHIDENPNNCRIDNLEWCTAQYNIEYSVAKAIDQYNSITGETIKSFKSISKAAKELGYNKSQIWLCCNGRKSDYKGFGWRYKTA